MFTGADPNPVETQVITCCDPTFSVVGVLGEVRVIEGVTVAEQ
jgi:hypothetical protein